MEQGGNIVHSSVHALSVVLGDVRYYDSDEHAGCLAGLAFDFGVAPALVCRQHEQFPHSLSMTLCAVRSDGLVALVMLTTSLDCITGYHFGGNHHYAANPTLEGYAPVMHEVDLADMFTATKDLMPLSFLYALVEANEEVQAYRLRGGGGPIGVSPGAEIHLGHFAPGQDHTPLAEQHHAQADGSFNVLDGIRICPEGVLIDRLGIVFRLDVTSLTNADDDPVFRASVEFPLDATVALLNERLVFS
jgi:hypothetical protein